MEIVLKPKYCAPAKHQRWILTTRHWASSSGRPVLIHPNTGEAYRPDDLLEAYPNWGLLPAREVVKGMLETSDLQTEGQALVDKFIAP